jgi:hypothetical protein
MEPFGDNILCAAALTLAEGKFEYIRVKVLCRNHMSNVLRVVSSRQIRIGRQSVSKGKE